MHRGSVRLQLTLWNVGVLAFVLLGLGLALRFIEQETLLRSIDRTLVRYTETFQNVVTDDPNFLAGPPPGGPGSDHDRPRGGPGGGHDGPPQRQDHHDDRPDNNRGSFRRMLRMFGSLNDYTPMLLNTDGVPFRRGSADDDRPWDPKAFARAVAGKSTTPASVSIAGHPYRIITSPLLRGGKVIGVAQVRRSLTDTLEQLHNLERVLWTLAPFALLVAGLGGAFLTNRALRPVARVARAAERVEASSLSDRLPVEGGGELAQLSATFNAMLERLEVAFRQLEESNERQRRFVADASHELRTPLSIIKANTSLALMSERTPEEYRKSLKAADQAADRTGRIVQDLLMLARADDNQLEYPLEPTKIDDVVHRASQGIHGDSVAAVRFDLPSPGLTVQGNPEALTRLFTNLLDNASRHTPPEGAITVSARQDGCSIVVDVADTGEGIAPEHLPHVGERFYRVDTARSRARGGTGLGLAICQSIIKVHSGTLSITSELGKGTTVTITLPAAA
jgi:signal transduction histidine kinase